MFRCGDGEGSVGGLRAVVEEGVAIPGCDSGSDPFVEFDGPGLRRGFFAADVEAAEIVDDAAAAGDQDSVLAEGSEGLADGEELSRRRDRERDGDDRYAGVRPREAEGRPGAVIESAAGIEDRGQAGGVKVEIDSRGESRVAVRGITDPVELLREASEIVDQGRGLPGCDGEGQGLLPVGGDDQDGLEVAMVVAEFAEGAGVVVAAESGHRGAVGEEDGGSSHVLSDAAGGCYDAGVAREEVLARLRERIVAFAASHLSRDAAEDLAQEALLLLHEKYAHLESVEELLPLSLQIVRFKIMSARRKSARRGEYTQVSVTDLPLPDLEPNPADAFERKEMIERLGRAMGQLGERCRELMRLKLQGRTFPEIQKILGVSAINTVYTWDHRCRKNLLELMGGKWDS